jgi:hypothetical protein
MLCGQVFRAPDAALPGGDGHRAIMGLAGGASKCSSAVPSTQYLDSSATRFRLAGRNDKVLLGTRYWQPCNSVVIDSVAARGL